VEREKLFLRYAPLNIKLHSDFNNHEQDPVANTLLTHFHASDMSALHSSPNGDCFFNSVSLLLIGDETRSTELRYRCCIEMVLKKNEIMILPQYKRLTVLCPPFEEDCIRCVHQGTDATMHMFLATSMLLNLPIKVMYAAVNSANTYIFKTLNTLIRPKFADPKQGNLTLMWTSMSVPTKPPTDVEPWVANHVVPLVDNVKQGEIYSMTHFRRLKESQDKPHSFQSENRYDVLQHEVIEMHDEDTDKGSPHLLTIERTKQLVQ